MKKKNYILSIVTVYMCYFTHGIQALILSQNKESFFTQWGYTDPKAGAAAVSLAITATGFGKLLSVWAGGVYSDRVGRKKMAVIGGVLYIACFALLLFTKNFYVACAASFIAGVATSGFWDASLYPAVQEATPKYASSALIGIKLFVSISGIIYPIIAVHFANAGSWHINVWIPLIFSVICTILAMIAPFAYDDMMKEKVETRGGEEMSAAELEAREARSKMLVQPSSLTKFITVFYAFLCMVIMYGAQQYTKAFGMTNAGLTEMQAAALTSVYTFGSIIAVIFWAIMMGKLRWNPLKVLFIDSIFTTLALLLVVLIRNVTIIYVAIALLGFFAAGGALQTGLSVRQEFNPGSKGRNTGIYYTWMGLATCFLPFIVSSMTNAVGEMAALNIMMGLLLVAAILATIMTYYLTMQYKKIFGKSALKEN